jgi:alpha-glucosidase
MQSNDNWWEGAVIYQVYPRSLKDTNGDGVGDLRGICESLDYLKALGVDAIWISPFFKSPMKDFGYDVSNYREIDPLFGTMEDFDELIKKAHSLGLKIIIDQILSHTSDQHAWFKESQSSRDNDKSDWYVWADANEDGTPPNNWLSIFGGCAWQWSSKRRQYYLHNFLKEQPDLNFHCAELRQQMLDEVEFWLKKGVDGLRLDAINFCYHDKQLRDNPAKPESEREGRYPGTTSLGEISSEDSLKTIDEYTRGDQGVHIAYSFELLVDEFSSSHVREIIERSNSQLEAGRSCWAISNHDVARAVSRWKGENKAEDFAKLLMAFLMTLPGTLCLYQGEELGLSEAEIAFDDLQDPYGITFWPEFKGRDGCRTPMPWANSEDNAGFSPHKPWLPIPSEHYALAVNEQAQNPKSTLNYTRSLLKWRADLALLQTGDIEFMPSQEDVVYFKRQQGDTTLHCVFNFSSQDRVLAFAPDTQALPTYNIGASHAEGDNLTLAPASVYFAMS